MKVAFLTSGGIAPCLSSSIARMIYSYSKLKKDIGKYFYDPYDGKIKQLVEKNGVLGFNEFNSVADIVPGATQEGVSTVSSSPYADEVAAMEQEKGRGYIPDEDIAAIRGY